MKGVLLFINVPNVITTVGAFATVWLFITKTEQAHSELSFFLTAFIIMSDLLDGYLARKLRQETTFGAILDRFRDKFFIVACALSTLGFLWHQPQTIMTKTALFSIILIEFFLFLAGIAGIWKKSRVKANWWGKWKMATECSAVLIWSTAYDINLIPKALAEWAFLILLLIACCLGIMSLAGYFRSYLGEE